MKQIIEELLWETIGIN